MAGQSGGPGLAPPPQDGPKPPNLQHGVPPGAPGLNPAPGPPSHAPFGNYNSMNGKLKNFVCRTLLKSISVDWELRSSGVELGLR